jgi:imidazolonepropionase-like amidohydrolase
MRTIIYGGPVFTGLGEHLEKDLAILMQSDKIDAVGSLARLIQMAPEAHGIDVKGRVILPGLIDAHRHIISVTDHEATPELIVLGTIEGVRVAHEALSMGITTVRDPGCKHNGIFKMKQAIDEGFVPGPTVYPTGPNPTGSAAPQSWRNYFIQGPWAMRQAVRELRRSGARWIKLVVSVDSRESGWRRTDWFLTPEEIKAAVEEARALGLAVSGHVEGLAPAHAVVEAGFSAIEHGTVLDEALAETMAKKGVFYVPTLLAYSASLEQWEKPLRSEESEAFHAWVSEHKRSFQRAVAAGVPIAVGTDMYRVPPLDCYVRELVLMVESGMSPAAALRAATATGAAILGEENEFGTLVPGMKADLIAVEGNPLEDIHALLKVDLVIKHGKEFKSRGIQHVEFMGQA